MKIERPFPLSILVWGTLLLSSLLFGMVYLFLTEMKSYGTLQLSFHEQRHVHAAYLSAKKMLQEKISLWKSLEAHALLHPSSRTDLETHLKRVAQHSQLAYIEMEVKEDLSFKGAPSPLRLSLISMKTKAAYDFFLFRFINHLQSHGPGLFHLEKIVISRVEGDSGPSVEADMQFKWFHTPEGDA